MYIFQRLLLSLLLVSITACTTFAPQPTSPEMVNWGSPEGITRLAESNYKVDFFKLANHFESQHNKMFCGPASAAIVLNALRIRAGSIAIPEDTTLLTPDDLSYLPSKTWSPFFQRYTQNNVFIASPKTREQVLGEVLRDPQQNILLNAKGKPTKDRGFQLQQLAALFRQHGLNVTVRVVDQQLSDALIKQEIIANLAHADDYVIINYKRATLKQAGGGHISPLAAYHQASDSFLVMDVTPNKADWVWVKAELLLSAMRTFDTVENRGYLLISEGVK